MKTHRTFDSKQETSLTYIGCFARISNHPCIPVTAACVVAAAEAGTTAEGAPVAVTAGTVRRRYQRSRSRQLQFVSWVRLTARPADGEANRVNVFCCRSRNPYLLGLLMQLMLPLPLHLAGRSGAAVPYNLST